VRETFAFVPLFEANYAETVLHPERRSNPED